MKEIRIKVHSFVDVITNSSTTIFIATHNNTVKMAKELVEFLLKGAGISTPAEDLFEICLEPSSDYRSLFIYDYGERSKYDSVYGALGSSAEREAYAERKYEEILANPVLRPADWGKDADHEDMHTLVIKTKTSSPETLDLICKVSGMFTIEEKYDG